MLKGKISLRQISLIFLVLTCSPVIRFATNYSSEKAKHVAWLTPFPAILSLMIMLFILRSVYKKQIDKSMMDVIYDIFGKWIGKSIVLLYFLWSLLLIVLYLRYNIERLVGTYPNTPMPFFLISTLLLIAYILPKGITIVGRMSEVLAYVLLIAFTGLCLFLIPTLRMDNLLPISTKDILPILNGSLVTSAIGSYFFLLFFMGDFINDKDKLFKPSVKTILSFVLFTAVIIFMVIGSLTASLVQRVPFSFLVAVKQISILDTIEKIESIIVGSFIFSDFILLSVMIFVSLNMVKSLCNLKETKQLLNIFLVLVYFLALGVTLNRFELEQFSIHFLAYINNVFGIIMPILLYIVGKIRKRI